MADSNQDLFAEAVSLHERGEWAAAEARYETLLAQDPRHFTALHQLGVLKTQRGDHAAAAVHLREAIALLPRSASAHYNLGLVLWNLEEPDEALHHYQYSLALEPNHPGALLNTAIALNALGRQEEALAKLDRLLGLEGHRVEGLNSRGIVLESLERFEEALACYDEALALDPHHAALHVNRGNVLLNLDRSLEALDCFDRAIALQPDCTEAHRNRQAALAHPKVAYDLRCRDYRKSLPPKPSVSAQGARRKALVLLPPYITCPGWECGAYPVESDLHYHFSRSLEALGHTLYSPTWEVKDGHISFDQPGLMRLLEAHDFDCCIAELNYPSRIGGVDWFPQGAWYEDDALIQALRAKVGQIVTFVGDAYPRGGILEVLTEAHRISDVVWCPYQGVPGMLFLMGRKDLLDKVDTTPCFATVFHDPLAGATTKRCAYELSYLGTPKTLRLNAVAEFCRLDLVNIFVNTTTRDFNSPNNAKPMRHFLDVLDNAMSTITSSARTPDPGDIAQGAVLAKYPEVFAGRFAESISRGCLPIYIARDAQDYPPLPNLKEELHYLRVEHTHEYQAALKFLRAVDKRQIVDALRDYHAAHLSPEALLAPILARRTRWPQP